MSIPSLAAAMLLPALLIGVQSTTPSAAPLHPPAAADEWPDFRGPTWDGHAPASARVPLEWSETGNVRWKTALHDRGWSSPVVRDGRAWMTTASGDGRRLYVVAVDVETGAILHDVLLFRVAEPARRNALNSYASPSAVIEEGRVYVHFGTYGTACLDTETAETLWTRRDLQCDHMEGPGSSPVLLGDLLVFHVDGGDVQYVVALDKQTGETRWRTERSARLEHLQPDMRKAYSTPIVVGAAGRRQLVSSGSGATVAYDPRSGDELWTVRHRGFSMSSRPVSGGGLVLLNTGFMKPQLWALRLGGRGDVTDTHVAWKYTKNVPTMASPLLVGDLVFLVSDGGIATCLEARTGERRWRERIGGGHSASPVLAAGRIYFFDREGTTTVVDAAPEFRVLATNQLDDGCMASAAVAGDAFLLRTRTHLYRIERERE